MIHVQLIQPLKTLQTKGFEPEVVRQTVVEQSGGSPDPHNETSCVPSIGVLGWLLVNKSESLQRWKSKCLPALPVALSSKGEANCCVIWAQLTNRCIALPAKDGLEPLLHKEIGMDEVVFYRPGDGVTIYVEVPTDIDDATFDDVVRENAVHGFIWVPDMRDV